jgi:hypothetical protein
MRHDHETTAEVIEQRLLANLRDARNAYERSPDEEHLGAYSEAIQHFSDYILRGILPPGCADLNP